MPKVSILKKFYGSKIQICVSGKTIGHKKQQQQIDGLTPDLSSVLIVNPFL